MKTRPKVVILGAWSYVTFQRGARLITGKVGELPRLDEGQKNSPDNDSS